MRVILAGVPGAGKTTVLNKVKELLPELNVINFGTLMFEIAHKRGLVENRDEMRKLPMETQKEIQRKAAEVIFRTESPLVIDTHLSIKTPKGYMPGFPSSLLDMLNPDVIVLITARPEEIWERRREDTTRKRDLDSLDDIIEQEKVTIAYMMAYSAISGAFAYIVRNHNGRLEEAVQKVKELFE